jgi:hypothetical protein
MTAVGFLGCLFPIYYFIALAGLAAVIHARALIIPGLCFMISIVYLAWMNRIAAQSITAFSIWTLAPLSNLIFTPALVFAAYFVLEKIAYK